MRVRYSRYPSAAYGVASSRSQRTVTSRPNCRVTPKKNFSFQNSFERSIGKAPELLSSSRPPKELRSFSSVLSARFHEDEESNSIEITPDLPDFFLKRVPQFLYWSQQRNIKEGTPTLKNAIATLEALGIHMVNSGKKQGCSVDNLLKTILLQRKVDPMTIIPGTDDVPYSLLYTHGILLKDDPRTPGASPPVSLQLDFNSNPTFFHWPFLQYYCRRMIISNQASNFAKALHYQLTSFPSSFGGMPNKDDESIQTIYTRYGGPMFNNFHGSWEIPRRMILRSNFSIMSHYDLVAEKDDEHDVVPNQSCVISVNLLDAWKTTSSRWSLFLKYSKKDPLMYWFHYRSLFNKDEPILDPDMYVREQINELKHDATRKQLLPHVKRPAFKGYTRHIFASSDPLSEGMLFTFEQRLAEEGLTMICMMPRYAFTPNVGEHRPRCYREDVEAN